MTSDSDTLDLARQLIREESVSPDDGDCQEIIGNVLKPLGFTVENMPFGPVKNLWASKTSGDEMKVRCCPCTTISAGPCERSPECGRGVSARLLSPCRSSHCSTFCLLPSCRVCRPMQQRFGQERKLQPPQPKRERQQRDRQPLPRQSGRRPHGVWYLRQRPQRLRVRRHLGHSLQCLIGSPIIVAG